MLSAPNHRGSSVGREVAEGIDRRSQAEARRINTVRVSAASCICGELFKLSAGVDLLHVPYKGGGPALTSLIGGHVGVAFATTVTAPPHVRAGKARALAVASKNRHPLFPEVPTTEEAGLPDYEVANWVGVVAPAGTPPAIIAKLHEAITALQDSPEMQKQVAARGRDVKKAPISSASSCARKSTSGPSSRPATSRLVVGRGLRILASTGWISGEDDMSDIGSMTRRAALGARRSVSTLPRSAPARPTQADARKTFVLIPAPITAAGAGGRSWTSWRSRVTRSTRQR